MRLQPVAGECSRVARHARFDRRCPGPGRPDGSFSTARQPKTSALESAEGRRGARGAGQAEGIAGSVARFRRFPRAGEREEHLVEARRSHREVGDVDAGRDRAPRAAVARGRGRAAATDSRRDPRRSRCRPAPERLEQLRRRLVESAPVDGATCSMPEPIDALSSRLVPSAILRPWSITAIRSASWSASSRYWVVSRIGDARRRASRRIMPQTSARGSAGRARWWARRGRAPPASRPGEAAMSSRRRMPPE